MSSKREPQDFEKSVIRGSAGPLRRRRQTLGLSVEQVARRADLTFAHVSRAERGLVGLSAPAMVRLLRALELPETADTIAYWIPTHQDAS